jgi:hypothetical protein
MYLEKISFLFSFKKRDVFL